MRSICVFLGSNPGADRVYVEATRKTGRLLAEKGLSCVYGGSDTGLMKVLADSVLESGGKVIGVTVKVLHDREIFHPGLTELHIVSTMHERKAMMEELSDAFVVLPGGIGTLEEFFEVYSLLHLGFHSKPCGVLNVNGYYAPLLSLLDNAEREGFMRTPHREDIVWAENPVDLLDRLAKRG